VEASTERLTTAQVWAATKPGQQWDSQSAEAKGLSRTLAKLADKGLIGRLPGAANRPLFHRLEAKGREGNH
jgi:DNA-binding MarR family transcriptional regulator